ncbi:MAG TPA: hypothetical protein VEW66_04500, partial [Thermomicrobiales bacterium]|nr:hypothetical protein [Thermomicrobiales bacterium]
MILSTPRGSVPAGIHLPVATIFHFAIWLHVTLLLVVSIALVFQIDAMLTSNDQMAGPAAAAAIIVVWTKFASENIRLRIWLTTGFASWAMHSRTGTTRVPGGASHQIACATILAHWRIAAPLPDRYALSGFGR